MSTNSSLFASSIVRAAHGTDLKSNIGIAKMGLDQVVKVLDKQLANDYLCSPMPSTLISAAVVLLLGAYHSD